MVDGIKRATHDAEPVPFMRLGTALPGQACRARWQRHPVALAMRATLPIDQVISSKMRSMPNART